MLKDENDENVVLMLRAGAAWVGGWVEGSAGGRAPYTYYHIYHAEPNCVDVANAGHVWAGLVFRHVLANASTRAYSQAVDNNIVCRPYTQPLTQGKVIGVQPNAAAQSSSFRRVWASLLIALACCSIPNVIMAAHTAACNHLDRNNRCTLPISCKYKADNVTVTTKKRMQTCLYVTGQC